MRDFFKINNFGSVDFNFIISTYKNDFFERFLLGFKIGY